MEVEDKDLFDKLCNQQSELSVLGTFFKYPDLFFSYSDSIKNNDFSDGATRFFHVFITDYLLKYSNEISPALTNTFASMDNTRLSAYRKFGGWKTIEQMMGLALDETGLIRQVEGLKKYSLLRGLVNEGFDVEKILGHSKFNEMDAESVASLMQYRLDSVANNAITHINKPKDMFGSEVDFVNSFFEKPSRGITTPFDFINNFCLGLVPKDSMFWGACSNNGKGRSLIYLAVYLAMTQGASVTVLENEMDYQRMAQAALVTACNAPFAQELTGCKLYIPEKRIVTALYKDNNGDFLYRYKDDEGNFTESAEQYQQRIASKSDEYHMVKTVAEYLQTNVKNKLLFKDIASNYTDSALVRYFNQAIRANGSDVVIYDTLKNSPSVGGSSKIGDWSALMNTATILQEAVAKAGQASAIFSFQLDRNAYHRRPEELNPDNIASCSQLLHIADEMVMFQHLRPEDYQDYRLLTTQPEWGSNDIIEKELDPKKKYSCFVIQKNRRGGGKNKLFITETNLDTNVWSECGEAKCIKPRNANKWNQ